MSKKLTPDVPGQIAFNPRPVGDITPALREQHQRDEQAAARFNRSQNQNYETLLGNVKQKEKAAEMWSNDMQSLTKFSQTLLDQFTQYQQAKNEQEMQEGISEAYMGGVSVEDQSQLEDIEGLIDSEDQVTQSAGQQAYAQTGDFSTSKRVREMSGWRAYGYQMGRAQMMGSEYSAFIEGAMNTDNTTQVTVNGRTFTPATASTPSEVQAAMATLRGKFMKESGMSGMNPALLNKYAFPQMHRTDNTLATRFHNRYAGEESDRIIQDAKTSFQADKNLGAFIGRVKGLVNPKTKKLYSNSEAHDLVFKYIEDSIGAGTLTPTEARSLKEQVVPWDAKGRTFGQLYETRIEGAIRNADSLARSDAKVAREELRREAQEVEQAIYQDIVQNPNKYTKAEIEEAAREYAAKYGQPSRLLDQAASKLSLDSTQIAEQKKYLENLRRNGALTTEAVLTSHPSLYDQFFSTAQAQEKAASADGGIHKQAQEALEQEIKTARKLLGGDATMDVVGTMVYNDVYSNYITRFSAMVANGIDPSQASQTAMSEALTYYQNNGGGLNNQAKPDGKFYKDNILNTIKSSSSSSIKAIEGIIDKTTANGPAALDEEGLVFSKGELLQMEENYLEPGWTIPPMAKFLSEKLGIDAYTLINRQRAAAGLQPLPSPGGELKLQLPERSNSLLNHFQSRRRTTRAISQSGVGYRPESVPYSAEITVASQQSGVPEHLIAAMMMIESGGSNDAISPTGAKGLMQIVPGWHPSYEGSLFDPQSNLSYGASYMQELYEKYGNWDDAVQAYNAGPGNWDKYLEDGRETQFIRDAKYHLRKFKTQLSAWDSAMLSDPDTQRFEVVQVVSTDPRYEGSNDRSRLRDVPGHGGANMHQHYEFATKEQTLLAKKLYEQQGFRVTSYMRPGDPEAHGQGYAIDVAPPLDLPETDEAEMAWIDKANAVIGL